MRIVSICLEIVIMPYEDDNIVGVELIIQHAKTKLFERKGMFLENIIDCDINDIELNNFVVDAKLLVYILI